MVPDSEIFQANVRSTYNVVEAACKLGVKKIMIASSETTYGVCFAQGDADYHSFPLEEDYDVDPEDSFVLSPSSHDLFRTDIWSRYALSKICGEKTARTFPGVSRMTSMPSESATSSSLMSMLRTFPPFSPTLTSRKGMHGVISMLET